MNNLFESGSKGRSSLQDILAASYQPNRVATNTLEKDGYRLDPTLSTREHKVFIDEQGDPSIVFRGTNQKSVKDIGSDILLGLGLSHLDPRQRASNALVEKVRSKYNKDPNLYGHSLGGALAEKSARATGNKGNVVTYNKGAAPSDVFQINPSNQVDVRTKNDPVSFFSMFQSGGAKRELRGRKDLLKTHGLNPLRNFF